MKELQEARRGFEKVRPHGTHDAEAAYKKDPELVREAAGGQLNRAIRALQLETELRTDPGRHADRFVESWQKLDLTSSVNTRLATCPPTRRRVRQWATWPEALNGIRNWNPSSLTASRISASRSNRAAGSATSSLSASASTLAEAGASESDPSDLPPILRYNTARPRALFPDFDRLPCLSQRPSAEGNTTMRQLERIIRLKTVLSRTGLSRSTVYRKISKAHSRPSSKSAPTGLGGMRPTSTAGLAIQYRGVWNERSMRLDEVFK